MLTTPASTAIGYCTDVLAPLGANSREHLFLVALILLRTAEQYTEPAAMEMLRQKSEKFEAALKKIARGTLEPGHVYEQAVMMQDIAIKVLQEEHGCTVMGAKVCFACGECDPLTSADLGKNCGGEL